MSSGGSDPCTHEEMETVLLREKRKELCALYEEYKSALRSMSTAELATEYLRWLGVGIGDGPGE